MYYKMDDVVGVIAEEDLGKWFFRRYPDTTAEHKLWDFCMSRNTLGEPFDYGSPTEDLIFYEDLLHLIQQLKQLNDGKGEPILIAPAYAEHTLIAVEGVVNLIKQAIPVGMIFNLSKQTEALDLVIVLEKSCTSAYEEFEHILDLSVLGYQKATCTVHNYGLLHSMIRKGHFFYATACITENLIYQKSDEELFPSVRYTQELKSQVEVRYQEGMQKVSHFYEGAQYYCEVGAYEMAMFMLQQTVELVYRCLLNLFRGRDIKCHSLTALRKHLKRFAPEVIGVFAEDESMELQYLKALEEAYVNSRYQPDYKVNREITFLLNERTVVLLDCTQQLFLQRLAILDTLIANDERRID